MPPIESPFPFINEGHTLNALLVHRAQARQYPAVVRPVNSFYQHEAASTALAEATS
ncbi:hypothetical protein [Spirosoma sp. KCTC 42546]|uniref:hypothetical protein n=1 Tax=Spirosoma sp. KCTC 42546 TaxID=2520506 RepID=UPI00143D725F|nr:hypothetical protein [Spirosoma sp. KCTC 42546]